MKRRKISATAMILWSSPIFIVAAAVLSILYGAKNIDLRTIYEAIFYFDADNVNHQIIVHSRLPRAAGALLIGAFLAVSGALMQGMTRNYLASPSIMGVTDGSAFAITIFMILMPSMPALQMMIVSFAGSALSVVLVFGVASLIPGGLSPVRLAVLGTIIGTFLSSTAAALAMYYQISQNVSFWYNARLHQLDPMMVKIALPFGIAGICLAMVLARSVTLLSLGDETAAALGQKTVVVKLLSMLAVVILTGAATALAGKIGFIGLIIPHIARFFTGVDYRKIIPCAAVLGAVFLTFSDTASRFLNYPYETPIGVVTAAVGVPFFLYLIRRNGGGKIVK